MGDRRVEPPRQARGQPRAGGLEPGLQPAPQLQERRRSLHLGERSKGQLLALGQHPPGDRLPVEPRPQPLHIHPHRAVAMQSDQDQLSRMAEIEGRTAGAVGLAMGTHRDRHGGRGAAQLRRQQATQGTAGPQKTVLILGPSQGSQPLPLRRRQAGPQVGGQGQIQGLAALDQQQQGSRRRQDAQGWLLRQAPGAGTQHRPVIHRRIHRPCWKHPT